MSGVFISGINGDIGSEIAAVFVEHGWSVAGADRVMTREIEGHIFEGDVTDEMSVAEWFRDLDERGFPLTSLVNVAGINYHSRIDECSLVEWTRLFDVNVLGMVRTIKYAVPLLRRQPDATIVNMSSISARIGSDGYSAYTASKAAIDGLTRALAVELAPAIRVNAIAPGWIDAGFTAEGLARHPDPAEFFEDVKGMHALGRIGTTREVGDMVYFMATPASSFMVGTVVDLDGGYLVKN
jgi:NAD(P)-dependent dehydrogenase (short-subunit alcohol dehydrogenase family)